MIRKIEQATFLRTDKLYLVILATPGNNNVYNSTPFTDSVTPYPVDSKKVESFRGLGLICYAFEYCSELKFGRDKLGRPYAFVEVEDEKPKPKKNKKRKKKNWALT